MSGRFVRNIRGGATPARLRKLATVFVLISLLLAPLTIHAFADMGPKPSLTITFANLPESVHYVTLLASEKSYGPFNEESEPETGSGYERYLASLAFLQYAAQDDYYYWGQILKIQDGSIRWGYYPPKQFKVLLYDVGSDTVYDSGAAERYAFDSFFKIRFQKDGTLKIMKDEHVSKNVSIMLARLVGTILIELLIAFLFGYRTKKEIGFIIIANLITQVLLNVILAEADSHAFTATWLWLFSLTELAVFAGEAAVYAALLKSHSKKRAVLYAVLANAASLLSGGLIDKLFL